MNVVCTVPGWTLGTHVKLLDRASRFNKRFKALPRIHDIKRHSPSICYYRAVAQPDSIFIEVVIVQTEREGEEIESNY